MDDIDRLKAVLAPLPVGARVKLRLDIQAGPRRVHTTTLDVERDRGGLFMITNKCMMVGEGESEISANSADKRCFDPVLYSDPADAPEPRITQTDVIQVVKTKLVLASSLPGWRPSIIDVAQSRDVRISAFNLLRQKAPIYEKYGYFNQLRSADIIATFSDMRWADVKDSVIAIPDHTPITAADAARAILGEDPADEELFPAVMKRITSDKEGAFNAALKARLNERPASGTGLSYGLLRQVLKKLGLRYPAAHTLDPTSPQWQHWSALIQVTGATIVAEGGRSTRRRRPSRRRRSSRRPPSRRPPSRRLA